MKSLHNEQSTDVKFEPEGGDQRLLCSNNRSVGSPSLGCISNQESSIDLLLERLAEILVDIHFELRYDQQKGGDLL
jgi:hypothetical protein